MSDDRPTEPEPSPEPDMYERPLGAGIDFADPNSRLAPLYFGISGVLAAGLLATVFLFYSVIPLNHTDVWVHLKYGERIVKTKRLPETEPFSPFTDKDQQLVNAQWLTQALYSLVFRAGEALHSGPADANWLGGAELLRVLHAVAVTAFLGLFGVAARRASGSAGLAVIGMALLAVPLVLAVGTHRPQTFGLTCFAAVLATVSSPEPPRRVVWVLPVLIGLWANLHGSFVLGFILFGILLIGRAVDVARLNSWSVRAALADRGLRRLVVGAVLSLAAVLINPYGPKLYWAVLTFGSNPNLKTLIEWTPLKPFEPSRGAIVFWGFLVANVIAFGVGLRSVSAVRGLAVLAFAAAALLQQRMIVWWIPIGVWVLIGQLGAILRTRNVTLPELVPNLKFTILSVLVVGPIVLLSPAFQWLQRGGPTDPKVVHPGTPFELVTVLKNPAADPGERMRPLAMFLRQHYTDRPVGPVFGAEGVGEFLVWAEPPGCPPFFFTHAHLFPQQHWRNSQTVLNAEPGWREILDRAGVNLVAVEPEIRGELVKQISRDPDWQVVVNEAGSTTRKDVRGRLFVAVRKLAN